jgi:hypothetical protein
MRWLSGQWPLPQGHYAVSAIWKPTGQETNQIEFDIGDQKLWRSDQNMKTSNFGTDISGHLINDYERAKAFRPPPDLRFEVSPQVSTTTHTIDFEGILTNESDKAVEIIVAGIGLGNGNNIAAPFASPFQAEIVPTDQIVPIPQAGPPVSPPVPPPPIQMTIPAKARVRFITFVVPGLYSYQGAPRAKVKWSFRYWNPPIPDGFLVVVLPQLDRPDTGGYKDWIEKDVSRYDGRYLMLAPSPTANAGVYCQIAISTQKGKTHAVYSVRAAADRDKISADLPNATIIGNRFESARVVEKERFPYYLPREFIGRFVLKYPLPNAKGPIEKGLLLGEDFYTREGEEP